MFDLLLSDRLWQFSNPITTRWVYCYLRSTPARNYFASMSVGTSQVIQNITKSHLVNIRIVAPVDEMKTLILYLDAQIEAIDLLAQKNKALSISFVNTANHSFRGRHRQV